MKLRSELSPAAAAMTVAGLEYDSRRVEKDFLFFAFAGSRVDGRSFAQEAMARGACAVVSELPRPDGFVAAPWIEVEHGRHALAMAARNFYRQPDERVLFTGITGTNGKTTTSYLIDAILRAGRLRHRIDRNHRISPGGRDVARGQHDARIAGRDALCGGAGTVAGGHAPDHGSFLSRAGVGTGVRDSLPHRGIHESHARSSGFSPHDGGVRGSQAAAVRAARSPAPHWAVLNADDPASSRIWRVRRRIVSGTGLSREAADPRARISASGFDGLRFDLRLSKARASRSNRR